MLWRGARGTGDEEFCHEAVSHGPQGMWLSRFLHSLAATLCMMLEVMVGVAGDMTAPRIGSGDLLLVSAGPGHFGTVEALAKVARMADARVACFTSRQGLDIPFADLTLQVPAQTMADSHDDDQSPSSAPVPSILPMGSSYEIGLWVALDCACILLQEKLRLSDDDMSVRHTNLE
ncbi:unnamed protein product [Ostreobium quekettii]|uniref:SIS domain-containing protein n=1 Tax=Ostreobium quekettii TaxID=121088 RepID=A0A8S1JEK1_9CHLO|nr:unnamed protein product [Ostreobium quekettii]